MGEKVAKRTVKSTKRPRSVTSKKISFFLTPMRPRLRQYLMAAANFSNDVYSHMLVVEVFVHALRTHRRPQELEIMKRFNQRSSQSSRWARTRNRQRTEDRRPGLSFESLEARNLLAGIVYADALQSPFQDWSYGTTVDLSNTNPVKDGLLSVAATHNEPWTGLYFGSPDMVPFGSLEEVAFSIHGGQGGQQLRFYYVDSGYNWVELADVSPVAGQWTDIVLDFPAFGTPSEIRGFVFQEFAGAASPTYYIDAFSFGDYVDDDSDQPGQGPAISIDPGTELGQIDDEIYGLNFADYEFAEEIGLAINRWGGNATSRYNYQLDSTNLGADWYFENYPSDTVDPSLLPNGSTADYFVQDTIATGSEALMTIVMLDWTAASREIKGSFPVDVFGPQQSQDPWHPNWGNGILSDGTIIEDNDPRYNHKKVNAKFAYQWVQHLVENHGTARDGGVQYYALDNEPMLWNSTHRDVHSEPASYQEVLNRGLTYARAIKLADPTAEILGPVVWGWTAYFYSALDAAGDGAWWDNPQDRLANGGLEFLPWYLSQMNDYQQSHGVRLLDFLDVHYYPQNPGVALSGAGNAATQQQRLESTRSLWDPAYVDETWIAEEVMLIPRMQQWIDDYYPDTKLAITEYNFGANEHINGAVTQADVLGIFGREGVDIATMWDPPEPNEPVAYAFRMYRNYDGQADVGSRFGDNILQANSADSDQVSVFAASRDHDGATTIMLINKSTTPLKTPIDVGLAFGDAAAEVYQYDASNLDQIDRLSDLVLDAAGQTTVTLPAYSITLLEMSSQGRSEQGSGESNHARLNAGELQTESRALDARIIKDLANSRLADDVDQVDSLVVGRNPMDVDADKTTRPSSESQRATPALEFVQTTRAADRANRANWANDNLLRNPLDRSSEQLELNGEVNLYLDQAMADGAIAEWVR